MRSMAAGQMPPSGHAACGAAGGSAASLPAVPRTRRPRRTTRGAQSGPRRWPLRAQAG